MFNRKQHQFVDDTAPALPPMGSAQRIPAEQFSGPAAATRTKRHVDMLVRSQGYNDYNSHRNRLENITYFTAFGLLGLFGFAYADFIAMIASGKVPSAETLGTLLVVSPYWLAVTLSWVAALIVLPCAFMTPWSSLFFELDEWSDVKGVLVFQGIAITISTLLPYYRFGAVHQPAKTPIEFCWTFAATAVPTLVGVVYYYWRNQHWQRAVAFRNVPLWIIPCVFGVVSLAGYDLVYNGRESVLLNPPALVTSILRPSVASLKHFWSFFQIHTWTALVLSYLWYMLPKFI